MVVLCAITEQFRLNLGITLQFHSEVNIITILKAAMVFFRLS